MDEIEISSSCGSHEDSDVDVECGSPPVAASSSKRSLCVEGEATYSEVDSDSTAECSEMDSSPSEPADARRTKDQNRIVRPAPLCCHVNILSTVQILIYVCLAVRHGWAPSVHVLVSHGAKIAYEIVVRQQWWRLFTAMMLHAGPLHLLGNISIQVLTLPQLESQWGVVVLGLVYVSSASFGFVASCIFLPHAVSVGCSGALVGVLGCWWVELLVGLRESCPHSGLCDDDSVSAAMVTLVILVIVATSWREGVDTSCHLGGLFHGLMCGCMLISYKHFTGCVGRVTVLSILMILLSCYVWLLCYVVNHSHQYATQSKQANIESG